MGDAEVDPQQHLPELRVLRPVSGTCRQHPAPAGPTGAKQFRHPLAGRADASSRGGKRRCRNGSRSQAVRLRAPSLPSCSKPAASTSPGPCSDETSLTFWCQGTHPAEAPRPISEPKKPRGAKRSPRRFRATCHGQERVYGTCSPLANRCSNPVFSVYTVASLHHHVNRMLLSLHPSFIDLLSNLLAAGVEASSKQNALHPDFSMYKSMHSL